MSTLEEMTTSTVRWERLSYGLALVVIAGVALTSNTERRLFGGGPGESAFAAVSPLGDQGGQNGFAAPVDSGNPLTAPGGLFGRRRPAALGTGTPTRVASAAAGAGAVPVGAGDGGAGLPVPGTADGGGLPAGDVGDGPSGRGGGASFAPDDGGLPALGGVVTGGGTTAAPAPTPTPTPTPTTTATPIPTAVPEAATWTMLIGGFALVGASLRRRRRSGVPAGRGVAGLH